MRPRAPEANFTTSRTWQFSKSLLGRNWLNDVVTMKSINIRVYMLDSLIRVGGGKVALTKTVHDSKRGEVY